MATSPAAAQDPPVDALVVGGGISGLTAAWRLRRAGVQRVRLLDREGAVGGTCRTSGTGAEALPWGAETLRVPPPGARCVHELLQDLGIINGYDDQGRPEISPEHLARWPQTRVFTDGAWSVPMDANGLSTHPSGAALDFADDMLRWSLYRGEDGRPGFAVPLRRSSRAEPVRELDSISFAEYLARRGPVAADVRAWAERVCRPVLGGVPERVSAWAAISCWAGRPGDYRSASAYPCDTLTWPGGTAYVAQRLAGLLGDELCETGARVTGIHLDQREARVQYVRHADTSVREAPSRAVVFAAPLRLAPALIPELPTSQQAALERLEHTSWLVAAVHLRALPTTAEPMALANWCGGGTGLGYFRADHQRNRADGTTALMYQIPLAGPGDAARHALAERPAEHWGALVTADLLRMHPGIGDLLERIDLCRWQNGTVLPTPGAIWGPDSRARSRPLGPVSLASCAASGLPTFDEAVYSGVAAAESALRWLGVRHASMIPEAERV